MTIVTLPAHFDGEHILLDEPYALHPNARLLVTVLSSSEFDEEREDWLRLSAASLARAYAEDEIAYTFNQIKEMNPEYEGG